MEKKARLFNVKAILTILVVIMVGYLASKFPDESVLIGGIALILIIYVWLMQVIKDNE